MTGMRRPFLICALAVLLPGCAKLGGVFEDVGDDPDPPRMELLGVGIQLPPSNPDEPPPAPVYRDPAAGITVNPNDLTADTLALRFSYFDAAADIDSLTVRDLDGNISYTATFTDVFIGAAGVREVTDVKITPTVEGPHRLQVWLEDLNGTRSAKTTFTVFVKLF
ncbi:MAG TPA: hypothetical protein VI078_13960 [bacterium]